MRKYFQWWLLWCDFIHFAYFYSLNFYLLTCLHIVRNISRINLYPLITKGIISEKLKESDDIRSYKYSFPFFLFSRVNSLFLLIILSNTYFYIFMFVICGYVSVSPICLPSKERLLEIIFSLLLPGSTELDI